VFIDPQAHLPRGDCRDHQTRERYLTSEDFRLVLGLAHAISIKKYGVAFLQPHEKAQ
jgi:hypothetical protein